MMGDLTWARDSYIIKSAQERNTLRPHLYMKEW